MTLRQYKPQGSYVAQARTWPVYATGTHPLVWALLAYLSSLEWTWFRLLNLCLAPCL
jgi:hypothetical protein